MVSGGITYAKYRCGGRFFGRRVNCESVPALPASTVRRVLDDPRKIPYLLVWRSQQDGTVQDVVRVAAETAWGIANSPLPVDRTGWIEIRRPDGACTFIRTAEHPLPRNGGKVRLLVCPHCQAPRRALYGWMAGGRFTNSAQSSRWQCRGCAGLRFASEGGALKVRSRSPLFRPLNVIFSAMRRERIQPWLPLVFSSPVKAAAGRTVISRI
jgi:hypothetical protein